MKQVIGKKIENLLNEYPLEISIEYPCDYFNVYELSDNSFDFIDKMSEEDFEKYSNQGWYRYSEGSVFEEPKVKYIINNCEIIAWDGESRKSWYKECETCSDNLQEICTYKNPEECFHEREYKSLTEYFSEEHGCGKYENVWSLAIDLAKYNNITIPELFRRYGL